MQTHSSKATMNECEVEKYAHDNAEFYAAFRGHDNIYGKDLRINPRQQGGILQYKAAILQERLQFVKTYDKTRQIHARIFSRKKVLYFTRNTYGEVGSESEGPDANLNEYRTHRVSKVHVHANGMVVVYIQQPPFLGHTKQWTKMDLAGTKHTVKLNPDGHLLLTLFDCKENIVCFLALKAYD